MSNLRAADGTVGIVEQITEGVVEVGGVEPVVESVNPVADPVGVPIGDFDARVKSQIDNRLEGSIVDLVKHKTGEDLVAIVTHYNTWMMGVALAAFGCIVGGVLESFAVRFHGRGIRPERNTTLWLAVILILDGVFFVWGATKGSLNIVTPNIALHQVSRMITEVFRGKGSGGSRMKIGVAMICAGLIVTTLFGVHSDPHTYPWDVICSALFILPFQLWIMVHVFVLITCSVIALVLTESESNQSIILEEQDNHYNNRLFWLLTMIRNLPVFRAACSIQVSSETKRIALASASGVLASYLLVLVQRILLLEYVGPIPINIMYTTILALAMGAYLVFFFYLFNVGLRRFETSSFLPLMMASTIVMTCVTDLLLLECLGDLNFTWLRIVVYGIGNFCVCMGLLLMGRADVRRQIEDLQLVAEEVSRMARLFDKVEDMNADMSTPADSSAGANEKYGWLYLEVEKDAVHDEQGDFVKSILDDMRIQDTLDGSLVSEDGLHNI